MPCVHIQLTSLVQNPEASLKRSRIHIYQLISQQQLFERLNQPIGRIKRQLNRLVCQCAMIDTQNGIKLRKRLR